MTPSAQLLAKLETRNIDELVVFHLAGREIAHARIEAGANLLPEDAFTDEESAFLMDIAARVLSAPSDYPRTPHLAPETIVRNGIAAKLRGHDDGFWT